MWEHNVFIINASKLKCLFPHSNVLSKISLIREKILVEQNNLFKQYKEGGYIFVNLIFLVL
jgi:hypothetical protein